jgi:menaquinol-cytochrome c reductase iron-sulfur subunit
VGLAIATPVVAYVLGPVLRRKEYRDWVTIGNATDFHPGETTLVTFRNPFSNQWDGDTANVPAYVRCSEPGKYTVFAINCAHLGCPVRWFSESQLFMCPCHGGVYYADGSRASGPPERGLFTYEIKVESGKLMIKAGQLPTLKNRASNAPCPQAPSSNSPALITRIESCPSTNGPDANAPGTGASTIG